MKLLKPCCLYIIILLCHRQGYNNGLETREINNQYLRWDFGTAGAGQLSVGDATPLGARVRLCGWGECSVPEEETVSCVGTTSVSVCNSNRLIFVGYNTCVTRVYWIITKRWVPHSRTWTHNDITLLQFSVRKTIDVTCPTHTHTYNYNNVRTVIS